MAGSASVVSRTFDNVSGLTRVVWAWTSDDGTGAVTCEAVDCSGLINRGVTNPGATAPTDNYDVVINDADGMDVMGGAMANRDTANTEQVWPLAGAVAWKPAVVGTLQPVVTNAGNSKQGEIILYIER